MSLFSRRALNDKEKPSSPNLVFHEIPLTPSMLAAGCARLGLFSLLAACFCPLGMLSRGQAPPPACLQPLTGEIWEVVSCEEIYRQAFWSTASFASQLSSSHLDTVDTAQHAVMSRVETHGLYFIPLIAAALLSMSTGSQRSRDHDFCFTVTYDD